MASYSKLPKTNFGEIGFWGRSNVGKSSLLNSIIKKKIAKISKTPGRTRTLNFFEIKEKKLKLVDFPGYGYAVRSKKEIYEWNSLILDYLEKRQNIIFIFLLIDCRRGLKEIDKDAIKLLTLLKNEFHVVLTKIDKINKNELEKCYQQIENFNKSILKTTKTIFLTSSKKNIGIKEIKKFILNEI